MPWRGVYVYVTTIKSSGCRMNFFLLLLLIMECPKCGKLFVKNSHTKQTLDRHLARKFPCDVQRRPPPPVLRSLETIVVPANLKDGEVGFVTINFFEEVVRDERNVCFVKPNMDENKYYVQVTDGEVKIVNENEFIRLWVNYVLHRIPRVGSFDCDVYSDAAIDIDRNDWDGIPNPDSFFIQSMKFVLHQFMADLPHKLKLKNRLLDIRQNTMRFSCQGESLGAF